jgi:archaellum component FlaC
MVKKNITIDELAVMVQKGFADTATKNDIKDINKRLDVMVTKAEMNRRFDGLEDRVLASHQKRIEKLETEIKDLRALFVK